MRASTRRRALLVGGVAAALTMAAGLAVANTAGEATSGAESLVAPETGAVFNDPNGTVEEQYAIRDHVLGLVEATQPGTTISMSIFNITDFDSDFANAVVDAAGRGVNTRVVLESTKAAQTSSGQAIIAGLGTNKSEPSWAVVCNEGCHGTKHNHNKFYLFSEVDGQSDIVVQSSANFTVSNGNRFWNNAVTFVGNETLYDAYLDYFDDLARNMKDADYYTTVNAGNVKTYHFPRAGSTSSTDTVYNNLGNVTCTGNTEVGTPDGRTIIRIGMWYFGRTAVANRLATLANQGCQIDIVYTDMTAGPSSALTGQPNVTMRQLENDEVRDIIHSKYMLIEGTYGVHVDHKVVFTGTPNYSSAALRTNDETMLRIYDDDIHDQYVDNFDDVFARGTPP